jgi:hypothetical protein
MYRTKLDDYQLNIEKARARVEEMQIAYSKGGSLNALNKANRELADAEERYRECYGLRVRDDR